MVAARVASAQAVFLLADDDQGVRLLGRFGWDPYGLDIDWSALFPSGGQSLGYAEIAIPGGDAESNPLYALSSVGRQALTVRVSVPDSPWTGALVVVGFEPRRITMPARAMLLELARLAGDVIPLVDVAQTNPHFSETNAPRSIGAPSPAPLALSDFIMETLVRRRAFHKREGFTFVSLRRWRSGAKDAQVSALKSVKSMAPELIAHSAGREITNAAIELYGQSAIECVVPIPCGHSRRNDCLSVRIGEEVAKLLGVPLVEPFHQRWAMGSSHPKQNRNLPPLRMRQKVPSTVLLVDDIATSGYHMVEAATELRASAKHVYGIVWIAS